MLYLTILLSLFVLSYRYDYKEVKKGRLFWYILILIIFICVAGLRYRLGIDSIRYEGYYQNLPTLSELKSFDFSTSRFGVGYISLNAIARSISDDFVAMQFIQAIYVNCVIFWFFYRYSQKIFFCIIIYALGLYFNFMCEVMREACAVATLLLAWPYFVNRKWIQYYALAVICILFHTSGFVAIFLPLLYLPKIRSAFMVGKRTVLVLLGLFFIASAVGFAFADYLKLLSVIPGMTESIKTYENSSLSGQILNATGILSKLIQWCVYPYLAILYIKRHKKTGSNNRVSNSIDFMVGLCLMMAVITIPITIFYRYNNYFFPFAIAAIGNWVYTARPLDNLNNRFTYGTWILLFIPYFFLTTYGYFSIRNDGDIYESARYYPYASIIDKSTDQARTNVQKYHHAY